MKFKRFINEDYNLIVNLDQTIQGEKIQKFISSLIEEFEKLWKIPRSEVSYKEICDGLEAIITKALYFR